MPADDFVALPAGSRIGRYEVLSVLGQGAFGITYRARDLQLGRDVAIKEYLPASLAVRADGATVRPRSTQTADVFNGGRERFVEEGRTIANLHDAPGIVRVFDYLEANGTAYIVMQLVAGTTLHDRLLREGRLPSDAVERILWPLMEGLEQVHAAGFLHRDIKPANILVDRAGKPILVDFGASRAALVDKTVAMTVIFTPGYGAVEQFTAARQGPWTDIYGMAATLYHAIVGKAPPPAVDRMIEDTCESLVRLSPRGFPRSLLAGIDAGLALRIADRPSSIAAWRAAFAAAGTPPGPTIVMPRPPAPADTGPPASGPPAAAPKRRAALWVAGTAVAAAGLATAYFATGTFRDSGADHRPASQAQATAEAALKKRAEDDAAAQRQAEADAAERARVQQEAQQARDAQAALDEARRQAEANETRLKAEAEAEARKQAEVEAAAKAKADADAAARAKADAEAADKAKADAEAAATAAAGQRAAEEDQRKAAEAAEIASHLSAADRQRLQVALTSMGLDTRGADGVFGPRSREMIAAWQRRQNQTPTGYLTAVQQQALLGQAAGAIARYDEEQKKAEEAKRKAEEEAKARSAQQPQAASSPTPTAPATAAAVPQSPASRDGLWFGALDCKNMGRQSVQGNVSSGSGRLSGNSVTVAINIAGSAVNINVQSQAANGVAGPMSGELRGRSIFARGMLQRMGGGPDDCSVSLVGP